MLRLSELSEYKHILSENSQDYGGRGKRAAHKFQEMPLVPYQKTCEHGLKGTF